MLPRGVDEYLERRADALTRQKLSDGSPPGRSASAAEVRVKSGSAEERAARKTMARIDKQLERLAAREAELNAELLDHAQDYAKLAALGAELDDLTAERDALELEWLDAAELVD
jgi:ATP-binding cassette subfamily F protein uup